MATITPPTGSVQPAASREGRLSLWWNSQTPARRRFLAFAGALSVLFLVSWAMISTPSVKPNTDEVQPQNTLLPKDAAKDLSMEGVAGDVKDLHNDDRDTKAQVASLKSEFTRMQDANGAGQTNSERAAAEQVAQLKEEVDALKMQRGAAIGAAPPAAATPQTTDPNNPNAVTPPAYGPLRTVSSDNTTAVNGASGSSSGNAVSVATAEHRPSAITDAKRPSLYLPSGTFVTGVLLTGVDAPTGKIASKDPVPVLARIKHDAILPNLYGADIRECFVIFGAVGDITSERAMMRSERISCVRNDRSVVDIPIDGFAVGEDGKAGMRGLLVSKQGIVLRRALLVGFAQSVSQAFGSNQQPLLASPGSTPAYGASAAGIGLTGVGSAMDRIADYYLQLADELHPVIEIESGRKVTLVVLQGRDLLGSDTSQSSQDKPIEHLSGHGPAHTAGTGTPTINVNYEDPSHD
jgi:conjugal transfer pilus assembly protein TraB